MKSLLSLWQELSSISFKNKLFVCFSMLVGFCIAGEYAITRPASTSIFLSLYSAKYLPFVWLATVPVNLLVVFLYNRFLARIGPLRMLGLIVLSVMCIHLACSLFISKIPFLIFFQFLWKDIYILLMFKQLWSLIHTTIPQEKAKYLYGLIYGMGTIGSIICSLIPGFLAIDIGSCYLFLLTIPLYAVLFWAYKNAFQRSSLTMQPLQEQLAEPLKVRESFRRSPFLIFLLLLVCFMQISVGLMEYQFNSSLELEIVDQDARTAYCGKITAIVNLLSGLLQCTGSFLLVHVLGLRGSHLFIPSLFLTAMLVLIGFPSFMMISCMFILLKSIDFSLFGVIREMLYIPLKIQEKFRAKAIIDVFAYRTSKALASCFILCLQFVAGFYLIAIIRCLSLILFIGWIVLVLTLFKKTKEVMLTGIKY